jgi:hypothetical protein
VSQERVQRWLKADLAGDARLAPDAVRLKLQKLGRDPLCFFRGTLPEFIRRAQPLLPRLPGVVGLVTGDLHLENLGTFRAEDGGIAFDLNDFDEITWAPLSIDLRRLLASAALVAPLVGHARPRAVAEAVLDGLGESLESALEDPPAPARVRDLCARAAAMDVRGFLADLVSGSRLRPGPGVLPLAEPGPLQRAMDDLCARRSGPAAFYRVLDAGRRLAGNGSLGRRRFLVLLQGEGGLPVLVDLKEPRPSPWGNPRLLLGARARAEQVERAARALRPRSEWLLGTARVGGRGFQAREHSPHGLKLAALALPAAELVDYAKHVGALLGRRWRRAGATAAQLEPFAHGAGRKAMLDCASEDAERGLADHAAFVQGQDGFLKELGL